MQCVCVWVYIYIIHNQHRSEMLSSVKFHEVLGFWDFYGILGFKVKMHHFERPASRRVVRKSVECCGFCWIRGPQVQLAFQRNWNSRKQSETVGNRRKQSETVGSGPAWSCQNCQSAIFLQKKNVPRNPLFFESAAGNSWKQLGLVPLTRQKTSYLKPFKVHFLYKLVLIALFLPSQRYEPQLFPTVSRCTLKKRGLRGTFFFAKKWRIDNFGTITPGRSRLFPTVSDCFRLFQFLWNASWTCGPLIQQKSQHSTLFLTTLLLADCSKWCILTLKPNIP